jgi:hypothetical protein
VDVGHNICCANITNLPPRSMKRHFSSGATALGLALTLALHLFDPAEALTINATHLASRLAGKGVVIRDATVTLTNPKQVGLFSKPNRRNGIGLTSGVVLSSAWATEENGANDNIYSPGSDDLQGAGYAAFDTMLPPGLVSRDACVFRIEFDCPMPRPFVSFTFVYGTDNYPWTGTRDNLDMMGVFLAGEEPQNIISMLYGREMTVNSTRLLAPFKDNTYGWYQTEMNGFTQPLTASSRVFWRSNVLHIVVADTGRSNGTLGRKIGAWLFLKAGSLSCRSNLDSNDDDYRSDDTDLTPYPTASLHPTHPPVSRRPTVSPRPAVSPHSAISPYPTGSPVAYPTGFPSITPEPTTEEPTPVQRKPTLPRQCSLEVFRSCSSKCGSTKCYDTWIPIDCVISPTLNRDQINAYYKKVRSVIQRQYCT